MTTMRRPAAWAMTILAAAALAACGAAPHAAGQANDGFAERIAITGRNGATSGSNERATLQAGEPFEARANWFRSVWWTWVAPATGPVAFDTSGSSFDTVLGVYVGNQLSSLETIAENDDAVGFASRVVFEATEGAAYQIAVGAWGAANEGGDVVLAWAPVDAD